MSWETNKRSKFMANVFSLLPCQLLNPVPVVAIQVGGVTVKFPAHKFTNRSGSVATLRSAILFMPFIDYTSFHGNLETVGRVNEDYFQ